LEYVALIFFLKKNLHSPSSRVDKRFFKPVQIDRWVVVIYETQMRFGEAAAQEMIHGLVLRCREVGKY